MKSFRRSMRSVRGGTGSGGKAGGGKAGGALAGGGGGGGLSKSFAAMRSRSTRAKAMGLSKVRGSF
jgi:hypothetical protein